MMGESDSCDKTGKVFVTKQNKVYWQTIPFPLAVKRSNYLGGFKVCKLVNRTLHYTSQK
jgi:hypothetical protein